VFIIMASIKLWALESWSQLIMLQVSAVAAGTVRNVFA
jgi:hypothetical protein